jgi:hypothetical protein
MSSFHTRVHILNEFNVFNVFNRWIHRMYEFIYVWIHWFFVRMNSFIIWIHLYKINEFIYFLYIRIHLFYEFISTKYKYEFIYSMNSSVQNKWIHLIVVRVKPELWARSANREGEARASPLPRPGYARLPRLVGYTQLPRPGHAPLSQPLGYTRLPRLVGYTRLPQPVRAFSQGGWVRMGLR